MNLPQIKVLRNKSEKDWTLSKFSILDVERGVGVEDEKRDVKVKGETRIPNGIYEIGFRYSPRFSDSYFRDDNGYLSQVKTERFHTSHELIWVMNVPNFEFVLWHFGNTDDDTDGCYIVGTSFADFPVKGSATEKQKGVSGSRLKYIEIYPMIFQLFRNNKAKGIKTFVEYKDAA